MSKKINLTIEEKTNRRNKLFGETPIRKALLINSIPTVIIMFVFGIYSFIDNILAVQLANDSYSNTYWGEALGEKNYVRIAMSAGSPITTLINAISLLFTVGISTRTSINLGANRLDRAKNTMRTGFQVGLGITVIMVPILLLTSKAWMFNQFPQEKFGTVVDDGYKYVSIIVFSFPLIFINQSLTSIFRVDGRFKEMMIASITPIFFNLFFDWVFMGPGNMGVEGGAWATLISYFLTFIILVSFAFFRRSQLLNIRNFFGKFAIISILGICLVGISPFLRNFASSITQSTTLNVIQDISSEVFHDESLTYSTENMGNYLKAGGVINENFSGINLFYEKLGQHDGVDVHKNLSESYTKVIDLLNTNVANLNPNDFSNSSLIESIKESGANNPSLQLFSVVTMQLAKIRAGSFMSIITSGAFPIFILFFVSVFGFAQGAGPLASYNFGAKKLDRVKEVFKWSIIYSFGTGVFMYFIGGMALGGTLLKSLGISGEAYDYAKTVVYIQMTSLPLFAVGLSGMIILSSTDRIFLNVLASLFRGFIIYFPMLYIFKYIAVENPDIWWLFILQGPIVTGLASLSILGMTIYTLMTIKKKHITLDERVEKFHKWNDRRKKVA